MSSLGGGLAHWCPTPMWKMTTPAVKLKPSPQGRATEHSKTKTPRIGLIQKSTNCLPNVLIDFTSSLPSESLACETRFCLQKLTTNKIPRAHRRFDKPFKYPVQIFLLQFAKL